MHREVYPPHIQRAIEAADAKRAKRETIAFPETDKPPRRAALQRNYPPDVTISKASRRDTLNATEAAYLARLRILLAAGELTWIGEHESMAFRIADGKGRGKKASFRPDFPVRDKAGRLELHEVKGRWREAARVRIKVAASQFGFRFVAVTVVDGEFRFEEFGFGQDP